MKDKKKNKKKEKSIFSKVELECLAITRITIDGIQVLPSWRFSYSEIEKMEQEGWVLKNIPFKIYLEL